MGSNLQFSENSSGQRQREALIEKSAAEAMGVKANGFGSNLIATLRKEFYDPKETNLMIEESESELDNGQGNSFYRNAMKAAQRANQAKFEF